MPTSKVYAHINMNALAPFLLFGRGLSDVGSVILHLDFLSAARGARRTRRAVRSAGFRPAVEWRRGLARGVGVVLGEGAARGRTFAAEVLLAVHDIVGHEVVHSILLARRLAGWVPLVSCGLTAKRVESPADFCAVRSGHKTGRARLSSGLPCR